MANTDAALRTPDVDARLARLEAELALARGDARRARRTSCALLCLAGAAAAGGLMAASQVARVEDVLRVRRLEVVGEGDKVVLLAQASETGGQLDLWSKGGTNTVRLACAACTFETDFSARELRAKSAALLANPFLRAAWRLRMATAAGGAQQQQQQQQEQQWSAAAEMREEAARDAALVAGLVERAAARAEASEAAEAAETAAAQGAGAPR